MTDIGGIEGAELARQLRDPEGAAGLAVIGGLAAANADVSAVALEHLALGSGMAVLELGCGLGDLAPAVAARRTSVSYTGLDRSQTMVTAALERHGEAVAAGNVTFRLGSSDVMPFDSGSFDRVLSIGLIHFWTDPVMSLVEVGRVLRSGGLMVMGCLGPDRTPPFAVRENGFYVRPADEWQRLCHEAGFASCFVESLDEPGRPQGLLLVAER